MAQNIKGQKTNTGRTHFKLGHTPWNKGTRKKYFCIDCFLQVSGKTTKRCHSCAGKTRTHTEESKKLISLHNKSLRGELNPNWKGGKGTERHLLMNQVEYKLWRAEVFEKDNYICQNCLAKGVYLNADHIKGWAEFPELRYEISNGQTLCNNCHYFKTFGRQKLIDINWGKYKVKERVQL